MNVIVDDNQDLRIEKMESFSISPKPIEHISKNEDFGLVDAFNLTDTPEELLV